MLISNYITKISKDNLAKRSVIVVVNTLKSEFKEKQDLSHQINMPHKKLHLA